MKNRIQEQLVTVADNIFAYLPDFLAGLLIIILAWIVAWFVKRLIVQVSIILKLDRFMRNSQWEADLAKADVRYGIYNFLGNIGFALVFLIIFDNALITWKLTMLSDLLGNAILYLPKIIIAIVIFGSGWLLTSWAQTALLRTLHRENVPRASLISRFAKIMLMFFFSAMALVELDIAREIVLIGFITIFVTLSAISVIITAIGGKNFLMKIEESIKRES